MRMISKKVFILPFILLLLSLFVLQGCNSEEEDFPTSPITFTIGFDAGTGADSSGRMLAELAKDHLGESINIVNKPGSTGAVSYQEAYNAKADGYNLVQGTATLVAHGILETFPFTFRDLTPIMLYQTEPIVIYVKKDSPFENINELVDFAVENPGTLKFGSGAPGGVTHILVKELESITGAEFNIIPSAGGGVGPVLQAAGGHVDAAVGAVSEGLAQLESGNLKALAITKRVDVLDTPTLNEEGIDTGSVGQFRGIFGPKGIPDERVEILREAFKNAVEDPKYVEYANNSGATVSYMNGEDMVELYILQEEILRPIIEGTK